jgi:hypothetical protein
VTTAQSELPSMNLLGVHLNFPVISAQTNKQARIENVFPNLETGFTYRVEAGTATATMCGNLTYSNVPQTGSNYNIFQIGVQTASARPTLCSYQNGLVPDLESAVFRLSANSPSAILTEKTALQEPLPQILATSQNIRAVAASIFTNMRPLTQNERGRLRKFYGKAYKVR